MKTNVGSVDRIARIAIGVILIALALTETIGTWGWIGIVPLVTGLMGTCPLYSLIGFSSRPMSDRPKG